MPEIVPLVTEAEVRSIVLPVHTAGGLFTTNPVALNSSAPISGRVEFRVSPSKSVATVDIDVPALSKAQFSPLPFDKWRSDDDTKDGEILFERVFPPKPVTIAAKSERLLPM